eukprot:TRINITY_DN105499_c0_g1_i1.p2 TRINITY_DN105499_c0_g1~~TRINITY_DN105499_c0_g1_i1.p2  ORF type:complete len:123 (+),score=27.33 TRINITY_DN105499_c0_g1_i1:46-369(+)
MARRATLLARSIAAALLLALAGPAFLAPRQACQLRGAGAAAGGIAAATAATAPALAGEPPSVGEHWYWDLGIGSLHGETASIILLVFGLLVVFSVLGAGGSSRKSAA